MNYLLFGWMILLSTLTFSQDKFTTQDVSASARIDGTLYRPIKPSEKLAIIIPGSGPTDRNGNQPNLVNNSLKFLAQELASEGINVYTFDKAFLKQILMNSI